MTSKRERIQAALTGQTVDRVPVGFWRHWPGDDQNPDSLAAVTLAYQRKYDLDFIKLPVSSTYCVEDYGITHAYRGSIMGDREYLSRIIHCPDDWAAVGPLDIRRGTYGWHLDSLGKIVKEKDQDTPVIVTMFHPLAIAAYLAGDELFLAHLREYPEKVLPALHTLAETSARFASACIEAGADGIFLSTRFASHELLSRDEFDQFGRPTDLMVLEAASAGWFNVLHLHGQHPMFKETAAYPVQAVNWHDRTSGIDLQTAARLSPKAVMGGVEQMRLLQDGSPREVMDQAREAIQKMNSRRLILTTGCTYPLAVPEANLMAMRRAVENAIG
ncbi:uroporphyrinogen decarboxylase [Dehalogenimonas formicexedens]|uniref:Uroporphyrinogen decarboxylase n=1 Tax=Dehalogenimonas formicexedens TaxID=1839801 RepID=A0A1P8F6T7_9CHLR|nr:uroporphyrinogen decarboxylase family protein [Dehalogenimonas formicexedens]APV44062.1 uroporphyrinogen decarboxylase [Dehalogenimonas formicexedens]